MTFFILTKLDSKFSKRKAHTGIPVTRTKIEGAIEQKKNGLETSHFPLTLFGLRGGTKGFMLNISKTV